MYKYTRREILESEGTFLKSIEPATASRQPLLLVIKWVL
jgi:hypothetical protein